MKPKKRILISIIILIALIAVFYFVVGGVTKYSGYSVSEQNSGFENCLLSKELALYINTPNTDEMLINTGLIEYLQFFKIHNCLLNNVPCRENNIDNFPLWIIDWKKIAGKVSVSELAEYSGCNGK